MKKIAVFLLALSSFAVSANVSQKCILEGQRAADRHVDRMVEKHGDVLNEQDILAIEQDATLIARAVSRSCILANKKR